MVRIGLGGLVFAQNVACTPGYCALMNLYVMGRDGSQPRVFPRSECPSFAIPGALAVQGNQIAFEATCEQGGGGGGTWLEAVVPYADGGTASNHVGLEWWGEPGYGGYITLALDGSMLYALLENPIIYPVAQTRLFSLSAVADGGAPTPFYAAPPVTFDVSGWSFAASAALVATAGVVIGDGGVDIVDSGATGPFDDGFRILDAGGASGLFVCPAGATCPSATKVEGVDAKSITALYADSTTLYFTDTGNGLFSCDGAAALAGSCAPKLLSCPVPPFTELRSDAAFVYLLAKDGSAILRFPR